jgi:hypothetical protein
MSHRHALTLWPVALAAVAALVVACTSTDATPNNVDKTTAPAQSSGTQTTPPPHEPIDLTQIPDGTALEPAKYTLGLLADEGSTRAVVDVPEGYAGHGAVIGSDDGDMAFWGKVTQVDTDPCLGGEHVGAGTSVHDLAALLVAQRHMKTTQPVPVTIGGYHGLYLKLTAPADIDRCRRGSVTIFTAGGSWLQLDVPSATFREWILNVHGQRVVGGTRSGPDAADSAGLVGMVESAEFTTGQP